MTIWGSNERHRFQGNGKEAFSGKIGVSLWSADLESFRYLAFNDDAEWEAFRSLLIPSAKADIVITELDENGKRI